MALGTPKKHWLNGFTLLELLVVIAVIGVLTSLLLPSLNRTKETGRSAVCKNNMHQVLLGMLLYSDDNNDYLPWPGGGGRNLLPDWVYGGSLPVAPLDPKTWVLPGYAVHAESGSIFYYVTASARVPFNDKYTNSFPVYRCPSGGAVGRARRVTYSMNGWFDPVEEAALKPQGVQRSSVVNPSQKILLVDETPEAAQNTSFHPGGVSLNGQFKQHNGSVNMGFVDTHIDTFRRQRVLDLQLGHVSLTRGYFDPYFH